MSLPGQARPIVEPADRWVTLVLMALALGISSADRIVLSIFIEPVKAELHLSDSGASFLTATIFAIFYVGGSIPLGILSDRGNRRNLVAACTALFSVMTAITGAATAVSVMLLSRIGVAVGEAGSTPLAAALLSDKFLPSRRYTVMTLFTLGVSVGAWVGASGAGYLEGQYGWRHTMMIFGIAGVPIALAILLFVREPQRGVMEGINPGDVPRRTTFRETLRVCFVQRSVFHTMMAGIMVSFWGWGLIWWAPTFLYRSFGMSLAEAGAATGMIHGIVGTIVVLISAGLLLFLGKGDPRKPLWFLATLALVTTIPSIVAVFATSKTTVIMMLWLFMPMAYVCTGPMIASITATMPPHMRGQATAIFLGTANFAALALAPQFVGIVSDLLGPHLSNPHESLRWALLPMAFSGFWLVVHLWLASRHIRADIDRLDQLL